MQDQSLQIKRYILEAVTSHPHDIVSTAMHKFSVTSTTIHRHINSLIKDGKLSKSGSTRNTKYFLQSAYDRTKKYALNNKSAEYKMFEDFKDIFQRFPKNIYQICEFGVTEMLNNAIDHSGGTEVSIESSFIDPELIIKIQDNGVGAFKTICDFLETNDLREGIVHITKGKITRDPVNHTGQGIFFTSRVFHKFTIDANDLLYEKDNHLHDWTLVNRYGMRGTEIIMKINVHSKLTLKEVFLEYDGDDFAFAKTDILVHLADFKESSFISRSQAKRILLGLEKFSLITLDFKKIESVGQGFVDEVFRVFANKHPGIKIYYINANTSVSFMIERGVTR